MNLKIGKNFKLINEFGIWHDLFNPALGESYVVRIYGKYDLLVDDKINVSPEDYWIALKDLDGLYFVQPLNACILAEKLMTLGFVPLKSLRNESN